MTRIIPYIIFLLLINHGLNGQSVENFKLAKTNDSDQQISLKDALTQLTEQYQLSFGYSSDLLLSEKVNTIPANRDLAELLDLLFKDTAIEYKLLGSSHVLLRSKIDNLDNSISSTPPNQIIIEGRIVDSESGLPIDNAALYIVSTSIGMFSDSNGQFRIVVPKEYDSQSFRVSLLGYEARIVPIEYFLTNQTLSLKQESYYLDSISIINSQVGGIPASLGNKISWKQNDGLQRSTGVGGHDLFRTVQLLPGIAAHNDDSAELIIRGSTPEQNLLVLDGIPIYKADHFYGIYSSINSSYVNEVNLFKNAMPIEYGGKTGGMVQLSSNSPSTDRIQGQLELNLLYSSAFFKIPVSDQVNISIAGRSTIQNAAESKHFDFTTATNTQQLAVNGISRRSLLENIPSFSFNDWNANIDIHHNAKSHTELNFYHSNDYYQNNYSNIFKTNNKNFSVENIEMFQDEEDWQNLGFSVLNSIKLNPSTILKTNMYYSSYENLHNIASSITRIRQREQIKNGFEIFQNNEIKGYGFQSIADHSLSSSQTVSGGSFVNHHDIGFEFINDTRADLSADHTSYEAGVIAAYQFTGTSFHTELGMRTSWFESTKKIYYSPRMITSFYLTEQWNLKSSFSINHQFDNQISYENRLGQSLDYRVLANNRKIPVGKSILYMLGSRYRQNNFSIDAEFYYKNLSGVLEFSTLKPGIESADENINKQYRLYSGTGKSIGMDLVLGYSQSNYSSWIAYTLSKMTNRFDAVYKGYEFPAQEDRRHQFKWIHDLRFGNFKFSGNIIFTSGKPYTDVSNLNGSINRNDLVPENGIARLPNYHRIDMALDYVLDLGRYKLVVGGSVFNLYNRKNVKYLQYIYSLPIAVNHDPKLINAVIGSQTQLLDRTFNINFKLEF